MPNLLDYDYLAPVGQQQDMRTSTYRAHRHINLQYTEPHIKPIKCPVQMQSVNTDPLIRNSMRSEMKTNYVWQFGDTTDIRNPALNMKMQVMKPYADVNLNFIKRNIRPPTSLSHQDFVWVPLDIPEPKPAQAKAMPSAIKTTKIVIDYAKVGYAKYLDPSATTNRLAYPHRSPDQIEGGIGRQDNITFYNWHKYYYPSKRVGEGADEQMCNDAPADKCIKRRKEYPCQVKHVPHGGLTTEVRSNYVNPNNHPERLEEPKPYDNCVIQIEPTYMSKHTESKIIGSGHRVDQYVG